MGIGGRKPNVGADATSSGPYIPSGEPDALPADPSALVGNVVSMGAEVEIRDANGQVVTPPELLTPDGAVVWRTLLPDLIATGVFRSSDAILLVELCETLASAQGFRRQANLLMQRVEEAEARCTDLLTAGGDLETLADAERNAEVLSGRLKRARAGYLQSMKLVMSIAGEFGISPVARVRLGLMRIQGGTLLGALGGDDD